MQARRREGVGRLGRGERGKKAEDSKWTHPFTWHLVVGDHAHVELWIT